jgi:hypothetical protein
MSIEKKTPKRGFLKFFLWFLAILSLILVLSYAGITIASADKSLPGITLFGQKVGTKNKEEIGAVVKSVDEILKEQKVIIAFEDKRTETSYKDLGIEVDTEKTVDYILSFGKTKDLPNYSYFKEAMQNKMQISPITKWNIDPKEKLSQLFEDKNKDAKNANLAVSSNGIYIEPEEEGYGVDTTNLLEQVEGCFVKNCKQELVGQKATKKSNINASDLQTFVPAIEEIIFSNFYLSSDHRNIYPKATDLIEFVDEERTVLSGQITFSDTAIDSYLEGITYWFDVKGKNKIISSVDGAILDEGREGIRLDITKSRENIKSALEKRSSYATLEVTTSPIEEEMYSPGNNPGKYPGRFIEINLSEQTLYRFEGTNLIGTHSVSTGKWSMPTPVGEYSINNKDPRAYSQDYDLYMPYWMAFIGSEYGIHELPEWADGTKEGESHLGTPVSHGCVRLGRGDAQAVYDWAEIGTPVFIHK